MYILGFGKTMDDVPDIAGDLTKWHDHQNLCWEGVRVVGTTDATGKCERGAFPAPPPMLHVWMPEHPCGPFAGIEGVTGSPAATTGTELLRSLGPNPVLLTTRVRLPRGVSVAAGRSRSSR